MNQVHYSKKRQAQVVNNPDGVKSIERAVAPIRLQNDFSTERFIRLVLLFEEIERGGIEKRRPELVEQDPNEERENAKLMDLRICAKCVDFYLKMKLY